VNEQRPPLIKAPDSVWASLEASLNRGEKPRRSRPPVLPLLIGLTALIAAVTAAVTAAVAGYWWARTQKPQWEVVRVEGSPSIGSQRIGDTARIAEGQWLQTDGSSRALLNVGDIGTVQVDPNTRLRIVAARPREQRLALARGGISATVNAPPRLFFVDTASSTAVDLGCAYTMRVDDSGNGVLRVTLGWVSLEWNGRESMVPAGASCLTRRKIGPGMPVFDDATEQLKKAVEAFDFDKGGDIALDSILSEAHVRDTLTLWHLLSRVDSSERQRVYDRMIGLVPLGAGLSADKILRLDREELDRWNQELAWKW
jgi:FecR protein